MVQLVAKFLSQVKKCNGVVCARVGDLFELFQDWREIFPFGFSFRFLRLGSLKISIIQKETMNLQARIKLIRENSD